ncbi:MAG TPA: carboxypeptidase-like regulatory domain-containing protein, partial [Chitinophagaceae bacterium]|nr:carboxypeptidase-like regulatory domain-containing protein [Chitinophagaceae bacterium]
MKSFLFATFLIGVLGNLNAQRTEFIITGKVLDQSTQLPLAGGSVFCQNTTIGTITNSEGNFTLRLPNGGYDLIVSYTGYETFSQRINDENASSPLLIELKKQDKSLEEVAVVGSNEVADGWTKYGQFFLDNFIGTTPNASSCKLENSDSLRFFYYK